MSLRTLHKHQTEAKYAKQERSTLFSTVSGRKWRQDRTNAYHRAVRRSQREVIQAVLCDLAAGMLAEQSEYYFESEDVDADTLSLLEA